MRIWTVPFCELDDQRVLGQHNEIHALHSLIVKLGRPWGGLQPGDEPYLDSVHEETIAEAARRGWSMGRNHQTPIERRMFVAATLPVTLKHLQSVRPFEQRRRTDRWHLVLRWGGFYRGRTPISELDSEATEHYLTAIKRYQAQGGCLHDGTVEDGEGRNRGYELCLLCKRAMREKGSPRGEWIDRGWGRNG